MKFARHMKQVKIIKIANVVRYMYVQIQKESS